MEPTKPVKPVKHKLIRTKTKEPKKKVFKLRELRPGDCFVFVQDHTQRPSALDVNVFQLTNKWKTSPKWSDVKINTGGIRRIGRYHKKTNKVNLYHDQLGSMMLGELEAEVWKIKMELVR